MRLATRPLSAIVLLLVLDGCAANQGATARASASAAAPQSPRVSLPRLPDPVLPEALYPYSDVSAPPPASFLRRTGTPQSRDNTLPGNSITDAGATLGRVLFYDKRLSANNSTSCSSCHIQQFGFSDTARFSVGFAGKRTARHSMALANARFGTFRFFWDERATLLEVQVLTPIQDSIEMGMPLALLVPKLEETKFYPPLFQAAFGTAQITSERISLALAQFVRSLVSAGSVLDPPVAGVPRTAGPRPDPRGATIFMLQCASCHVPSTHSIDAAHNTGLDSISTDAGAGGGRFKAPSLRNVAVRPPYMHDGRFATLREVIEFYDHGVRPNPDLDPRLRAHDNTPLRMNLSAEQIDALIGYLESFTDSTFLAAPKFSDPFLKKGS